MGDPETHAAYRPILTEYSRRTARALVRTSATECSDKTVAPVRLQERTGAHGDGRRPQGAGSPEPTAQAHHERVCAALDALGIAFVQDPMLVRGFDYYTKTVFEFACDRLGAQSGIGGWPLRRLVEELGGPPYPRIVFGKRARADHAGAAGGRSVDEPAVLDCYLAIPDDELRLELMPLMRQLRAGGGALRQRPAGAAAQGHVAPAASLGARTVAIIGPREHAAGFATLRDMTSGDQREVPLNQLAEALL